MDADEAELCPVCNTGVLEQDAVMEEMEERCGVGELLHHRVRTGPKEQGRMKELKTFNATDQTTVFLKCFQKLLQDQAKVVNSWFECKAYNSVLKQIWKLVLLDCKLLDTEALYKAVKHGPGNKGMDSSDSGGDSSDDEDEDQALSKHGKALTKQVEAWTLKLPLWPSDLTDAALAGTLPFLGAANTYRNELEGQKYAIRAMRDPLLQTVNVLIAKAQTFAASVKMIVPELNLGAFVHRHCACLGLPRSVGTAATHIALARVYSTRRKAHPHENFAALARKADKIQMFALQPIQKAQVLLPILLVCKHALKCAAAHQDEMGAGSSNSKKGGETVELMGCSASTWRKEMKEWVVHWQSVLELQHLSWPERCRIATQTSMKEVLEFTRVKILNDPEPPSAFRSLHAHLKQVRQAKTAGMEDEMASDDEGDVPAGTALQHGACGYQETQEQGAEDVEGEGVAEVTSTGDVLQVLSEDCSVSEFSGQVFLQLMRLVAHEMGLRMSTLDVMLLEFEHSVTIA